MFSLDSCKPSTDLYNSVWHAFVGRFGPDELQSYDCRWFGAMAFLLLAPTHSALCCWVNGPHGARCRSTTWSLCFCQWIAFDIITAGCGVPRLTGLLLSSPHPRILLLQTATVDDLPLVELGDLPAIRPPLFVEAGSSSPMQVRGKGGIYQT